MAASTKTLKTCENGHQFYKRSDCPTCERERKPDSGFLALLAAPAIRALANRGISTLQELADCTEKEILQLHGMGPKSMPILRTALSESGLSFKS